MGKFRNTFLPKEANIIRRKNKQTNILSVKTIADPPIWLVCPQVFFEIPGTFQLSASEFATCKGFFFFF